MSYSEEPEIDDWYDAYTVAVEREQIREANERNMLERMRKDTLKVLKEELEQVRAAYERAKKASSHE